MATEFETLSDPAAMVAPSGAAGDAPIEHQDEIATPTNSVPILFIDTCSILDVMRDPARETPRPQDRQAAIDVVEAAEAGQVRCLVAEQVTIEFAQHDEATQEDSRRSMDRMRKELERITHAARIFVSAPDIDLAYLENLVPRARALVGRLIRLATVIVPEPAIHHRAYTRMNMGLAPGSQGKDSSKDCLVYLTMLAEAKLLRDAGHAAPIVFLSSNTRDYLTRARKLRPEIVNEFDELGMAYAPTMSVARHKLGL